MFLVSQDRSFYYLMYVYYPLHHLMMTLYCKYLCVPPFPPLFPSDTLVPCLVLYQSSSRVRQPWYKKLNSYSHRLEVFSVEHRLPVGTMDMPATSQKRPTSTPLTLKLASLLLVSGASLCLAFYPLSQSSRLPLTLHGYAVADHTAGDM